MSSRSNIKTRSQVGILLTGLEKAKRNTNNRNKRDKENLYENNIVRENNLIGEIVGEQDEMLNAMSIEQLKGEVIRLRELTLFQGNQLTQLHNQVRDFQSNQTTNEILQTLTKSFRSFNLDIKPPKFVENMNPNQFLNKFEKFCALKHITGSRYISWTVFLRGGRKLGLSHNGWHLLIIMILKKNFF